MTLSIPVQRWSDTRKEELSEAAVRALFPSEKYRVSQYRYPPLTQKFHGIMRSQTCHVLAGACRFAFIDEVVLRAGDVARLPAGEYSMEVLGEEALLLILCFELPFEFSRMQ